MPKSEDRPQGGDVLVMAGTKKGTFLFWSDPERKDWRRSHSHLGWTVNALSYDARHDAIYAATNSAVFGALVQRSVDGGLSWESRNERLDFAADDVRRVREIWQVQPGHSDRPQELWAGTGVAGLFRSKDGGTTWQAVDSLHRRATADSWSPGFGGLILHTILVDPQNPDRIYVAVSTGGAYRTDDGGDTWQPINRNVRADFLPDPYPETGQCVHKMALHPAQTDTLYQQNHCGVYRSNDRGDTWIDISAGLPSRFGFPMAVHPHDPSTIYVTPLVSDDQRFVPDGEMAVWRSRDAGDGWQRLTQGLPNNAWFVILREGMDMDPCDPAGVYVGTTTGQIFFSRDEGDTWEVLADFLPPVLSVSAAQVVS